MPKKKIYTVATSHLDTVWSWDFETTVSQYIYNTLVDNFKLFEKYPSYKFSFEGSYRYELMEEYYPELFDKMKDYIAKGRWNVCGSAFENGDTNIPLPEALFRNILFGNSYFDEKFGKRSVDIYLPDCFGFGWALPAIERHSNLMGFTTQKLAWGSAYGIPFDIGKWQGVDSSEVYASINPHDYYYTLTKLRDWDFVLNKFKENEKYDLNDTYIFHGIGDRGGAPDEKSVAFVEEEIKKNDESDIEVIAASADEIYHDIENNYTDEQKAKLPVWKNEFVMQNHGVGGYTSRAIGKRWNRRCEELADISERAGVISSYLGLTDYNQNAINRSWKRFIAHQFHDDMPGTSCQRVYKRSWNDYALSMNQFTNELEASMSPVSSLMKTDFCSGIPVMVYNPVEADRRGAVTLRLDDVSSSYVRVYDEKGREIKSQVTPLENGVLELVFVADVKSLGTRVYDVRPSDRPCCVKSEISINSDNAMENQKYIVTLNRKGNISSILDKELDEKEILKEPITLGLFNYTGSKEWPAWEMNFKEANKDADRIPNVVTVTVLEQGPARVSFKVVQSDRKSIFTNIIALTDGCDIVEVYSEIEWQNLRTLAKNKFSFTAENEKATFDLGLGAIERGNMSEKLFEVPAQKWVDLTDKSGEFGVSVLSECKYGWDKPDNNTLRLTCIHSPLGAFTKETRQDLQDLGRNCFSFGIYGHKGDIENGTNKESMNFARKLITCEVKKSESKGEFSQLASLLKITHDNIVIRAVKMSEDDENALIVRLNNATAIEQKNAALSVYREFEKVDEVNTSEEFIRNHAEVNGKVIRVTLKPFETMTLKIKFAKSEECENNNTYSPMRLNYNVKAFTNYDNMKHIILQGGGYSLPIDLIDRNIKVNGIEFYIPHGNRKNKKPKYDAVACRGQSINLDGKYNQIYILAGAVSEEDIVGTFKIDRKDYNINFKSMTAPYSKWDMYGLGQTAHTDDETAFGYEFTHLHHPEGNLVKKARLYLYSLNVKNKKRLRFPNNNKLVIFAMTSAEKEEFTNLADNVIDIVDDNYDFGKIPPIDKITDKTDAITIRAGKIQDQYNGGKGKGFLRDNLITNIIRSYTKSEW